MSKRIYVTQNPDELKRKLTGINTKDIFTKSLDAVQYIAKDTNFIVCDDPDELLKSMDYKGSPKIISTNMAQAHINIEKLGWDKKYD